MMVTLSFTRERAKRSSVVPSPRSVSRHSRAWRQRHHRLQGFGHGYELVLPTKVGVAVVLKLVRTRVRERAKKIRPSFNLRPAEGTAE